MAPDTGELRNKMPDQAPSTARDEFADAPPEQIGPGVTRQWLRGHRIIALTLTSVAHETIDIWATTAAEAVNTWPRDQVYLSMHDVSSEQLSLTPYIRSRVLELVRNRPEAAGRTAVVINKGVSEMIMRLFLNQLLHVIRGRPLRLFTRREEAIAWLLEALNH